MTGVQTCALPISESSKARPKRERRRMNRILAQPAPYRSYFSIVCPGCLDAERMGTTSRRSVRSSYSRSALTSINHSRHRTTAGRCEYRGLGSPGAEAWAPPGDSSTPSLVQHLSTQCVASLLPANQDPTVRRRSHRLSPPPSRHRPNHVRDSL